jgi:DnaJ domain
MSASGGAGLFSALGLPARADLTDDDVRAAWRRLAAATHPDRADGGDPARFAAAAAAYTVLRTPSGRGEALADLAEGGRPPGRRGAGAGDAGRPARRVPAPAGTRSRTGRRAGRPYGLAGTRLQRVRRGRPVRLLLRVLIAVAIGAAAAAVAGLQPATPALWVGILTWFVLTARHDLAPPG